MWKSHTLSRMRKQCRSSSISSNMKGYVSAAPPASTLPARCGSPRSSAPAIPSWRSSPLTGPGISRSSLIRSFCNRKTCRYPRGSSASQTSQFHINDLVMNLAPAGALAVRKIMSNDNFPPTSQSSRWLVSTDWLADHLRDPKVVVVDATYFLPQHNRDAYAEYKNAHIPGAVFFDIEAISDHSTELPHMLPGPTQLGDAVGALGIGDGDSIVVYDNSPLFSAARVW